MALDKDFLDDHISRHGPFMFHVTPADAVPPILAGGLRPGSELGISTKGGFFKTRQGHVYLGDPLMLALVELASSRAYLQIDLSKLDPARIDPDEDQVQGSFDRRGGGWVAKPPPVNSRDGDPENVGQALADWAETTEGFDAPEVTAKSLASGRVSYRGAIPPEAIQVVTLRSEGPELFHQGVLQALNDLHFNLTLAPLLGFYKTEVARALALARSLIASAAGSVGEPVDRLLPDWPHSEHAIYTRDLLIAAARDLARAGQVASADILRAAQHVAEVVPDIQPELGWPMTRDACVNVATAGVGVITTLRDRAGRDGAATAAQAAMTAVAEVPPQS